MAKKIKNKNTKNNSLRLNNQPFVGSFSWLDRKLQPVSMGSFSFLDRKVSTSNNQPAIGSFSFLDRT